MRTRYLPVYWLLLAVALPMSSALADSESNADQIVVHLSHFADDLHAVTMSLGLAAGMANEGATVTLMLDLEGPRLVDNRQSLDKTWGGGKSVGELYDAFIAAGGTVLVCPHCAHHTGLTSDNLRDGARIAAEGELAKLVVAADKVIDY